MDSKPTNTENLFAIVLAAGRATRFGTTKQLHAYGDSTLIARAVRLAEASCGTRNVLVVGCDWQKVAKAAAPLQGFLALNSEFAEGLGGSIACGIRSVSQAADAVLLLLADQPLITKSHIQDLVRQWSLAPRSIVASAYADTAGPPLIFPRADFDSLARLEGDRGAKQLTKAAGERLITVPFADAEIDIDRPEDIAPA